MNFCVGKGCPSGDLPTLRDASEWQSAHPPLKLKEETGMKVIKRLRKRETTTKKNMQSLHLLHTWPTCTKLPVAKMKTNVLSPREDKVNIWLSGLNVKNKVIISRKEED